MCVVNFFEISDDMWKESFDKMYLQKWFCDEDAKIYINNEIHLCD
jgi:hypothetical protein